MNIIEKILFSVFFSIVIYFHFQEALKQHEKLLRMTPSQQAEQLEIWQEESEAEAEAEDYRDY